jgi:hypothetical protein
MPGLTTVTPDAPSRSGDAGSESQRATRTLAERTRTEQTRVDRLVRSEPHGSAQRLDGWGTPPAGTDPELWRVLSAEERAFFTRAPIGAPTYGRAETGVVASDALRRGLHLDIRA